MATNFGWAYDASKIAAATERIEATGAKFALSADRPALAGYWRRLQAKGVTCVSAQDDEMKLNGKWRDPNNQSRGTCVGQGSSRAIEDVHNSRLVDGVVIGVPTLIAYEPMYGYERNKRYGPTQPWGSGGKCNDGMSGADAAAFYSSMGVLRRANYSQAGVDLSVPHEELAIKWNNTGVPDVLIAACAFHKIQCHSSNSWDEFADAIAAKFWGHICLPELFGYSQVIVGPYGTVEPDSSGGHDTEVMGVLVLPSGETGFMIQNSWGLGPKYPPVVQSIAGPVKMRPGSYVVRQKVLEGIRGGVERISCDIPSGSSFR